MSRGVLELQTKSLDLPLWSGNHGWSCRRTDSTYCFRVSMGMLERETLGPGVPCGLGSQIPPFPTQCYFTSQGSMQTSWEIGCASLSWNWGEIFQIQHNLNSGVNILIGALFFSF